MAQDAWPILQQDVRDMMKANSVLAPLQDLVSFRLVPVRRLTKELRDAEGDSFVLLASCPEVHFRDILGTIGSNRNVLICRGDPSFKPSKSEVIDVKTKSAPAVNVEPRPETPKNFIDSIFDFFGATDVKPAQPGPIPNGRPGKRTIVRKLFDPEEIAAPEEVPDFVLETVTPHTTPERTVPVSSHPRSKQLVEDLTIEDEELQMFDLQMRTMSSFNISSETSSDCGTSESSSDVGQQSERVTPHAPTGVSNPVENEELVRLVNLMYQIREFPNSCF